MLSRFQAFVLDPLRRRGGIRAPFPKPAGRNPQEPGKTPRKHACCVGCLLVRKEPTRAPMMSASIASTIAFSAPVFARCHGTTLRKSISFIAYHVVCLTSSSLLLLALQPPSMILHIMSLAQLRLDKIPTAIKRQPGEKSCHITRSSIRGKVSLTAEERP